MKQRVINNFNGLGKVKITFNPAIKIKMTPHSQPTWIDDMCKVNQTYMLTVSNKDDARRVNIDSLNAVELQSLNTRLCSLLDLQEKIS